MEYPSGICSPCGQKHGRVIEGHVATFYPGKCEWCGQETIVTEPRDYGYPQAPKKDRSNGQG
jgi:hypothetical protein